MQSDAVRAIGIDYACWLNFDCNFTNINGSKWVWFEWIYSLYCLHLKILIKTTIFRDDQLKGILLQFIGIIKSITTRETSVANLCI
jgi:hypothetical protein